MNLVDTADLSNWDGMLLRPPEHTGALMTAQFALRAPLRRTSSPAMTRLMTDVELDCLTQTFGFFIVRGSLETPYITGIARQQMAALAQRKPTAGYLWGYGFQEPVQLVHDWVKTFGATLSTRICFADIEDTQSFAGMTVPERQTWMLLVWDETRAKGYRPGLYTSPTLWTEIMGGMSVPDDVVVWYAGWDGVQTLDGYALGGRAALGHQYDAGSSVPAACGLALDRSVFDASVTGVPLPVPVPDTAYAHEADLESTNHVVNALVARIFALHAPLSRLADVTDPAAVPDGPSPLPEPTIEITAHNASAGTREYIVGLSPNTPSATSVVNQGALTSSTHGSASNVAYTGQIVLEPPNVSEPISWHQLLGGFITDYCNPVVVLAFLGVLVNWLQTTEPVTARGLVTLVALAIVAAVSAAQHISGTDGLQLRLRVRGQIRGGK